MYSDKIELDKFYTKPEIVDMCLTHIDFSRYDFVIEPSAGNGSFYNKVTHPNKIGLDLAPEHPDITEQNWFDYQIDFSHENVLVIGNPPFGKRNLLSKQFIQHALSFYNVSTVAFVLPNVYMKYTNQKIIHSRYRISHIIPLPRNSFTIDNKEYHVPCSFFVFDKSQGEDLRFDVDLYKTCPDFEFTDANDYDFFVMGAAPNTIKDAPTVNNRGYYVKSFIELTELEHRFRTMEWDSFSSCNGGVAWRTKPELIKCYMDKKHKYS